MKNPLHIQLLSTGDGLENGCYTFHAGFPRIDNFFNTKGDLIALSNDLSLQAANTIIISEFTSGSYQKINIYNNSIALDEYSLSTGKALVYQSHFQYPKYSFSEIKQRVQAFIESHHTLFPAGSLLEMIIKNKLPQKTPSAFDEALHDAFEHAFSLFEEDFFGSISRFRGRGHGLTPAGDDFIAGVLYGIHCLETTENKNLAHIKNRVFDISTCKNPFSNTLLKMAMDARYFKRLKDFLQAFFFWDGKDVKNAFERLLSTGHTSGADLLAGYFSVFLHKPVGTLRISRIIATDSQIMY